MKKQNDVANSIILGTRLPKKLTRDLPSVPPGLKGTDRRLALLQSLHGESLAVKFRAEDLQDMPDEEKAILVNDILELLNGSDAASS